MKQVLSFLTVGLIVLLLGCDNPANKKPVVVPLWAQGTWYTDTSSSGIKVAEITSSQYVAFQVTGYDLSRNPIVHEFLRMDCTSATNDLVVFAGGYEVKKLSSPDQISVGTLGTWITVYKQSYTVIYNANGGSGSMASSAHVIGEAKNLNINTFTRTGYDFMGWATSSSGSVVYADGQSVNNLASTANARVTLYAVWYPNSYMVDYDANGGNGTMEPSYIVPGESQNLRINTFARIGYIFGGWAVYPGGPVVYTNGQSVTNLGSVGDTITLYAVWGTNFYTVIYNANSGNGTMGSSAFTLGESQSLQTNAFTRIDYAFMGWATSPTGPVVYANGQSVNNLASTAGATVTLYAVWSFRSIDTYPTLADKLEWLQRNAQSNTDYILELNANENIPPIELSYSGKTNIGITIISAGAERIIGLSSRGSLFTVDSGITLTLDNNITLQGRNDNNASLVLVNTGGTLVINTGAKITGNKTSSSGGGVYVENNATFTMNGGEISGNTVSGYNYGGGVYVSSSGTFTMHDGDISGNYAVYSGGVNVNNSANFTMYGGKISGNTASYYGGGVYVRGSGTFTMNGGEISGNSLSSSNNGDSGGGVYVGGTFRIVTGTIYGSDEANISLRNTAYDGMALHRNSGGSIEFGTFSGSTWNSNGTLDTIDNTIQVVNGVLFSITPMSDNHIFNVATTAEWNSALHIIAANGSNKNCTINVMADFDVTGRSAANFGTATNVAVSIQGAGRTLTLSRQGNLLRIGNDQTVILQDLTLRGRGSNNTSLVYVDGGTFTMQSGKISGNSYSYYYGGGVYVSGNNGTFTMNGGEISGNTVLSGGGVYVDSYGTFAMNGGKISGNTAHNGGGVYIYAYGTFAMNDGEISNNTTTAISDSRGGGVHIASSGTFTMYSGKISGNSAASDNGGGVHIDTSGTFTMHSGEISGNTALSGGGVNISNGTFTMHGGEISGNTASSSSGGGGVYVGSYGTFTMYGGEISGNTVSDGSGGGGIAHDGGGFRIVTGTIYGLNEADTSLRNTATSGGAALYWDSYSSAEYGTFSGDTWNPNGNLNITNDTIQVVDGVLQ
jgi:uncharacterized repeat protein (TIGR02543 family)